MHTIAAALRNLLDHSAPAAQQMPDVALACSAFTEGLLGPVEAEVLYDATLRHNLQDDRQIKPILQHLTREAISVKFERQNKKTF